MRLPKTPPDWKPLFAKLIKEQPDLLIKPSVELQETMREADDRYWNWESTFYRASQANVSAERLWALIKWSRQNNCVSLPVLDNQGKPFTYKQTDEITHILHKIDQHLGGTIGSTATLISKIEDQLRYLITSLREEAISSSLIEGAVTTRVKAKEMLRSGREPQNHAERMILNNYRTISDLNKQKAQELTPQLIRKVQNQITYLTLKDPNAGGRYRLKSERIALIDDESGETVHTPPHADTLPDRMEQLCRFANHPSQVHSSQRFIHPAIRAIVLHFWLAYDHPFVDGNGRTARAIFYWSMLRSGYWLAEFMSISTIILNQPKKYYRAFINTEMDDNDLTYFIHYHLAVIDRSIDELGKYIQQKQTEQKNLLDIHVHQFNPRQRDILVRSLKDPTSMFTYASHANSHGVTLVTARADLLDLKDQGLLNLNRKGRQFEFTPTPDIHNKLGVDSR